MELTKNECYAQTNKAIRRGELIRPDNCEKCGTTVKMQRGAKIQAHHADHQKPLEVEWLCLRCHSAVTVRIRPYTYKTCVPKGHQIALDV